MERTPGKKSATRATFGEGMRAPLWNGFATRSAPLIYLSCPKSACTAIKNVLFKIDSNGQEYGSTKIHGDREALLRVGNVDRMPFALAIRERRLCFTFVREPYARGYSAFIDKFFCDYDELALPFRNLLIAEYAVRFPSEGDEYSLEMHRENFQGFLRFVRDTTDGASEVLKMAPNPQFRRHWIPQTSVLSFYRERINIDFVGRVERFTTDMQFVLDMVGVTTPIDLSRRYNEGPTPPYTLREVMTPEIAEDLAATYGPDVEYFGYHNLSAKYVGEA